LCFVERASFYNFVNKVNLVHNFSWYVYCFSLHVSGDYVSIISRNNCIYATFVICHPLWMTVWYAPSITVIQVSHRYRYFSWWWAHSRPKHVEKRNKHTKKNHASGMLYLQDIFSNWYGGILRLNVWISEAI